MLSNLGTAEEPCWVRLNSIVIVEYSETGGCLVTLSGGRVIDCPHSISEVLETMNARPATVQTMPPERTVAGRGPAAGEIVAGPPDMSPNVGEAVVKHMQRQRELQAWRKVVEHFTGPLPASQTPTVREARF